MLQEIAAARHVTILSHEGEVDGEVFCRGLEVLGVKTGSTLGANRDPESLHTDTEAGTLSDEVKRRPDTWGLVRTAAFLIKDAGLRRKRASGTLKSFSLNIRPLLEMIRMYHDRDATDRRDKIFALFGMSSDIPEGIAPDYNVSWSATFHRLTSAIVGNKACIRTEDDHEIALICTKFHVIGSVSKASQRKTLDDVQELDIRLAGSRQATNPGFSVTSTHYFNSGKLLAEMPARAVWIIHAPVVSIREGDIVCVLTDTTQPTIIRPHNQRRFCVIIAISTAPVGATQSGRSAYELPQGRLPAVEEVPILWDWSVSDRGTEAGDQETSDKKASMYSELVNTAGGLPQNLDNLALEINNWSRLAFQTGKGHLAVQTIESFLSTAVEVDEERAFQLLGVIDMFRRLYTEVGTDFSRHHKREALTWMADKLRREEGDYVEVTESMLFMAILYPTAEGPSTLQQKLAMLARYRGSHLHITTEVLKAAVMNFHGLETTDWALERLRLQRHPFDVDVEEVVNTAAKTRNYKAMAKLVASLGEKALVSNAEVAKALWHPKTQDFWPNRLGGWAKVAWMPSTAGPLFDSWREKIPIEAKQTALEELALHKNPIELLQSYLKAWNNDGRVVTTTMLANAAMRYDPGSEVVFKNLLNGYGDQVPMTEEVMNGAIWNWAKAREIVTVLLEYCGNRIPINEEMAKKAIGEFELLETLFQHYGDQIPITEEVMKAAIRHDDIREEGFGRLKLILKRCGDRIQISEGVMEAAAASKFHGPSLMGEFFGRYGERVPITGRVLGAAVREGNPDTIHRLLSEQAKRGGELAVDKNTALQALLMAKQLRPWSLVTILKMFSAQHRDDEGQSKEVMGNLTAGDEWMNASVVNDLISADFGHLIPITEALILEVMGQVKKAEEMEAKVQFSEETERSWLTAEEFDAKMRTLRDEIARTEKVLAWLIDERCRRIDENQEEEDWETEEEETSETGERMRMPTPPRKAPVKGFPG